MSKGLNVLDASTYANMCKCSHERNQSPPGKAAQTHHLLDLGGVCLDDGLQCIVVRAERWYLLSNAPLRLALLLQVLLYKPNNVAIMSSQQIHGH